MAGVVHAFVPLQVTSQPHEVPQDTPPSQLPLPLQVTRQAPGPHTTSSHELTPLHSTTQLAALEQSTVSQSLLLSHRIVQAIPAGHSMMSSRHRLPEQSIVQSA